jgi:hypothetical protein
MTHEPVAIVNGMTTIVEAGIALAVGFGLDWDAKQIGLVMAVVVAVGNLVKTLWARSQVTPVTAPRDSKHIPLVPNPQFER